LVLRMRREATAIGSPIYYLPILPKSTPIINIIRLDNKGGQVSFYP
jgi:hypothetical protein